MTLLHGAREQRRWPALNGGDAAILYCFVFLYTAFAGPGAWSIDAARRPNASTTTV